MFFRCASSWRKASTCFGGLLDFFAIRDLKSLSAELKLGRYVPRVCAGRTFCQRYSRAMLKFLQPHGTCGDFPQQFARAHPLRFTHASRRCIVVAPHWENRMSEDALDRIEQNLNRLQNDLQSGLSELR